MFYISSCIFYRFLKSTMGNWRNAVYIECGDCPISKLCCSSHLFTIDADGSPLIIPVPIFQKMTGELIDESECIGVLDKTAFDCLYQMWLVWHTDSTDRCSILELLQKRKNNEAKKGGV